MMKYFKQIGLVVGFLVAGVLTLSAQPPGGGPGGSQGLRFDPKEMFAREKQNLYDKVTDLTDDQKVLLDGIYNEFGQTFEETMQEAMQQHEREAMRSKMEALMKEKDELIKDVLNEDQYKIYDEQMQARRNRRQNGPPRSAENNDGE